LQPRWCSATSVCPATKSIFNVVDVFLDGRWMEIEAKFDDFKLLWEGAKATAAGIR